MRNTFLFSLVCISLASACWVTGCKRSASAASPVLSLPEGWRWVETPVEPALVAEGPEVQSDTPEARVFQPNIVIQERFWMGDLETFRDTSVLVVTNRTRAGSGEWEPMELDGFDAMRGKLPNSIVRDKVEIMHEVYLLQVPTSHVYMVTHTYPKLEGQPDPAIEAAIRQFKALEHGELIPKKE